MEKGMKKRNDDRDGMIRVIYKNLSDSGNKHEKCIHLLRSQFGFANLKVDRLEEIVGYK